MTCMHVFQWGNNSSGYDNIPEVAELPASFKPYSFSQVRKQAKEMLLSEQRKPETHLQLRLERHSRAHGWSYGVKPVPY